MSETFQEFSDALAARVAQTQAAVVAVSARRRHGTSGVIWRDGLVVTAAHGLQREEGIRVTLPNGATRDASLAGQDAGTDVALLRVEGAAAPTLPKAGPARAGELILVVGRSPDSGVNASFGMLSAVSGPWRTWRGGHLEQYLRLDARLFPQSSGGAVVNSRGEFLGLASAALSRLAGLAVPSATVERVGAVLHEHGFAPRGYLGVGVQPVPLPADLRRERSLDGRAGLMVLHTEPGGPAARAGLLLGDVLVQAEGKRLELITDLQDWTDPGWIGKTVTVTFIRAGQTQTAPLTVSERPAGVGA